MKSKRSLICVVDDDASIRESLPDLLRQLGYAAHIFSSAEEFLKSEDLEQTDCLILDVAMPGMSGPELQGELTIRRRKIPIIFITGQRDEGLRPRLLERGAVECLLKPFSEADLLEALHLAFRAN
jgi:FixJ family two-component response regulator